MIERALSASEDHTLKLWDLASGQELATLSGHSDYVTAVVDLPDGERALSASEDHTLKLWATSQVLATFTGEAAMLAVHMAAQIAIGGDAKGLIHILQIIE